MSKFKAPEMDVDGIFYVDLPHSPRYIGGGRYVIPEEDKTIGPKSFVSKWHLDEGNKPKPVRCNTTPRPSTLKLLKRILALDKKGYNRVEISKKLGRTRRALRVLVQKYGHLCEGGK